MIDLLFKDFSGKEWRESADVVPSKGDLLILDRAQDGVRHRIMEVVHRIGGGAHRIVVHIDAA